MSHQYIVDPVLSFTDKAHEALMSVWWTGVLLKKESRRFFKPYVASDAQFNILMMLRFTDKPLTQNEISEKLLVDKSNVTGLMDNMEKLGLIKRQEVAGDRRSYHIHLMPEGRKLIDKLNQIYETKVKNIMSSFSGKEQIELIKLTRKLRIALNESAERK